jgi:hypothetical protein
MATHDVTITTLPRLLIGGNDICFEIREGSNKLGELRISQGNLEWHPSGYSYPFSIEWDYLTDIAKEWGKQKK